MSGTAVTRLTFADFERLAESACRQELLHGELIEMPPAKRKHNKSAERFYLRLVAIVTGSGGAGHSAKFILGWDTGSKRTAGLFRISTSRTRANKGGTTTLARQLWPSK
jgi:Putative restriction endonuclease